MKSVQVAQLVALLVGIAIASAEPPVAYGPPGYTSGFRPSGFGGGYSGSDGGAPEPFSFQYEVKDPQSGNDFGHQASSSDGRRVQGQYTVLLPDGRRQVVKYTADDNGYNADVQYEGQPRYPQGTSGGYPGSGPSGFGGYKY